MPRARRDPQPTLREQAYDVFTKHLLDKRLLPGQTGWATLPTVMPDSGDVHHHPFDSEINELVDCIRAGRETSCNVADGYKTHELCMAIDRSAADGGRPVKLPLE